MSKAVKINDADYEHMGRLIKSLQERYGRQFDRSTFISMMFDFIFSYPPNGDDQILGNCKEYNDYQIMLTRWHAYMDWCWGKGLNR